MTFPFPYSLRSTTRSNPGWQAQQLPSRSSRPWFHLQDLYSILHQDRWTLCLEETFKGSTTRQAQKWNRIREWNRPRAKQLHRVFLEFQDRWGRSQCMHDVMYRLPCKGGDPPSLHSSSLFYIHKLQCEHTRHRVRFSVDGLLSCAVAHCLCHVPSETSSAFWLVGIQTGREWTEYHEMKYQTMLLYTRCFDDLWSNKGYVVYHTESRTWKWYPHRPEMRTALWKMIRSVRQTRKYAEIYVTEEELPPSLWPNMKVGRDVWKDVKSISAEKRGELTLLWNITERRRQEIWKQGVYSWKDPRFQVQQLPYLSPWKREVLNRIVTINRQSDFVVGKKKGFEESPTALLGTAPEWNHVFLDFEYTEGGFIYLTGIVYEEQTSSHYVTFWAEHPQEEEDMLLRVRAWLRARAPVRVWYWHVDQSLWKEKHGTYPSLRDASSIGEDKEEWIDLCHIVRHSTVFRGAYDFGLKSIVRALAKNGLLAESYDTCTIQSGDECLRVIEDYLRHHQLEHKQQLEAYNRLDCMAVCAIFHHVFYSSLYLEVA